MLYGEWVQLRLLRWWGTIQNKWQHCLLLTWSRPSSCSQWHSSHYKLHCLSNRLWENLVAAITHKECLDLYPEISEPSHILFTVLPSEAVQLLIAIANRFCNWSASKLHMGCRGSWLRPRSVGDLRANVDRVWNLWQYAINFPVIFITPRRRQWHKIWDSCQSFHRCS